MWQIKGESSYAINDFNDAAEIALKEVNAAGGVGGKDVKSFRVSTDPLDPAKLAIQFAQGVAKKPSAMIGLIGPALQPLLNSVTAAKIPVIFPSVEPFAEYGAKSGSKYLFQALSSGTDVSKAAAQYAVQKLGAKKIALAHTNDTYGGEQAKAAESEAKSLGATITTDQSYANNATDLTNVVLAVKGADAIINFGFQATTAILAKQLRQNGVKAPLLGGADTASAALNGVFTSSEYPTTKAVANCNPHTDKSPAAQKFADAYKAVHGTYPSQSATVTYDSVHFIAAAAAKAQSSANDKILGAMKTLTYQGVCGNYQSDGAHIMLHQVEILSFSADGTATTVATYPVAARGGAG